MRSKRDIKEGIVYQDYRDDVHDAFNLLGGEGYETADRITDYLTYYTTEEDLVGTSLALWIFSVGYYEAKLGLMEDRVVDQLSYHIPCYEEGEYSDITKEERKQLDKDIAFIKSKVTLIPRDQLKKVED